VRLTGAGRQFVDHCRRIMRELGRAQDELRSTTDMPQGRVVLGLSPTIAPLVLPGIVERVKRQCPQISLKVVEGFSIQLYDALLAGRVDLGLLTSPAPSRALKLTPLISEPIVVLAVPEARGTRRFYTLPELAKTPVITTEAIRSIVDDQVRRYGARLNIEAEIDAVEAIRRLLLRGIGPAVMPVSTFNEDIQAGTIAAFPIADANVQRILMVGQPAERKPSAASEEIAHILTAETNRLFDIGLFSLPATGLPQLIMPAPAPRRAARAGARKN
jgi:LysR family transcriptional regulator, nitrogen assimilation regulatory protein